MTVFECEIQARFRDVNLAGHVDNVEAMRIVNEAQLLFLHFADLDAAPSGAATSPLAAGVPRAGLLSHAPDGIATLIGGQRVEYHAEMRFVPFQPFLVRQWVSRVGRSSFTIATELRVALDRPPALVAAATHVLWDTGADGAWTMEPSTRGLVERYAGTAPTFREI